MNNKVRVLIVAPSLRITGFAMFGGVSIETRLAGESGRDARKRDRREARALRDGRLGALPAGDPDRGTPRDDD